MFAVVGDIAACAGWALKLWQYGWSKARNASDQYNEFGQDVYRLHENLLQLEQVFRNVQGSARGVIPPHSDFFNTSSLNSILDEPFETIAECRRLLHRREHFAVHTGAVSNILWNVAIEADVTALHNRIKFHNLKIAALLTPLQIKLLLDIRNLVIENGENILAKLAAIEAKLSGEAPPQSTNEAIQCQQIEIPDFLWHKFEEASRARMPELERGNVFPLNKGINAFLTHYKEAPIEVFSGYILLPPAQTPEQYLCLMKAIWIIQAIQVLPEYINACQSGNRLLKLFIEGLADKCLAQFNRLAQKPPGNPFRVRNEPDEATLRPLGEEAFSIWPKSIRQLDSFDVASQDPLKKIILRAALRHQNPSRHKEFILVRHDPMRLEFITKETSQTDQSTDSQSKNIDLREVFLTPLYADPNNTTPNIDLNLCHFGYRGPQDLLSFRAYKDLYRFQEAITGYRTAKDLLDINVDIQQDKATKLTRWRARAQFWNSGNDNILETQSPVQSSRGESRQFSDKSSSSRTSPSMQYSSRMSFQSNVTKLTSVTSLAGTDDGAGIDANILELPRQPYLVLFLRPRQQRSHLPENQILSLLRIPMHEGAVHLDTSNCRCKPHEKRQCTHTDLAGTKKFLGNNPLIVQRYNKPELLNLALLGAYHQSNGDHVPEPEKLGFISLSFKSPEDREGFDNWFKTLQELYKRRLDNYERTKRAIRTMKHDR